MKVGLEYKSLYNDKKWMLTINWKLIKESWKNNIHFNIPRLEEVIWYDSNDKNSVKIWKHINWDLFEMSNNLFPEKLEQFLELDQQ